MQKGMLNTKRERNALIGRLSNNNIARALYKSN